MTEEFKTGVVVKAQDIFPRTGVEVVDAEHIVAVGNEAVAQVGAQKTGAAGYHDAFCRGHW